MCQRVRWVWRSKHADALDTRRLRPHELRPGHGGADRAPAPTTARLSVYRTRTPPSPLTPSPRSSPVKPGDALGSEHERWLCANVAKGSSELFEHFPHADAIGASAGPLFVTDYPKVKTRV